MAMPIWTPSSQRVEAANVTRFMAMVRQEYAPSVTDYASLYRWSIGAPEEFWPAVWRFCDIKHSRAWDTVLEHPARMPGARWFSGARLNFADNLLRRRDEHPALVAWNEHGRYRVVSYAELYSEVARLARSLQAAGVVAGDRIAGFLPNIPETVTAMLASASLGAIWSSCSPDFGLAGLLDRFGQIKPKVLFTAAGYLYGGKRIDSLERVRQALPHLPEVQRVITVPYLDTGETARRPLPRSVPYAEFLAPELAPDPPFTALPFDHSLYILYSSGTTGKPKCIVHGAGGTLIQHLKELALHTDLKPEDRIFYFTTCGWMMWHWLVSSLALGATVVLYDGSAFHPQPQSLFDLAEQERVTIFGASAKYLASLEKAGVKPRATHHLDALKTVLSTGSPLAPAPFDYVYRDIKEDVQLASISGGTDIISCFALGHPCLPVYRGELQCRGLGMKVEVYGQAGRSVAGARGELVCTSPFPSMPIGFWNDPDGAAYRRAYFERFPNVWGHGDYAEITQRETVIIYGRSDATLNPSGVRIGTAEIYRPIEAMPEILECLAVGQEWHNDVRIILFVKLREGLTLDHELITRIKNLIREHASPRHVPAKVIPIRDIPRTRSGKIVELAVRELIHHRPIENLEALANPEALEAFNDLPELLEE